MSTQNRGADPVDSIIRLLLRLFLVPLGYFCAVLAGAVVIVVGEWRVGTLFQTNAPDELVMGAMLAIVTSMALLMVLLSFMWMVAAVGILFSELFAVRSWLFHAANGVASAWIGAGLMSGQFGFSPTVPADAPALVSAPFYIVAAGLAGGLIYWLVAGCTAGFYKPILRSAAQKAGMAQADQSSLPEEGAERHAPGTGRSSSGQA